MERGDKIMIGSAVVVFFSLLFGLGFGTHVGWFWTVFIAIVGAIVTAIGVAKVVK